MRGTVEVRLPASPAMIPTVRTLTSDLAARADFDLDAISDLRMAVDEASTALVSYVSANQELRCVFVLGPDRIEATVSAVLPNPAPTMLNTAAFGWRILRSLVDEVHTHTEIHTDNAGDGGDDQGHTLISIRLVKRALPT
jgi:serine/threonine-protein kinase RsbW